MSAASAPPASRLEAARRRVEDAKAALATGSVVVFSLTGVAVAASHPGHHKQSSVSSEDTSSASDDALEGGTLAPAVQQPQVSSSLS
jgi:hypothetical protein